MAELVTLDYGRHNADLAASSERILQGASWKQQRIVVVLPAAAVVAVLMLGAVTMHLKVRDPVSKYVPAALMLAMSVAICVISRL